MLSALISIALKHPLPLPRSLRCRFCERCNQMAQPEWRYIVSITLDDHTGHTWATAFAASLVGLTSSTTAKRV